MSTPWPIPAANVSCLYWLSLGLRWLCCYSRQGEIILTWPHPQFIRSVVKRLCPIPTIHPRKVHGCCVEAQLKKLTSIVQEIQNRTFSFINWCTLSHKLRIRLEHPWKEDMDDVHNLKLDLIQGSHCCDNYTTIALPSRRIAYLNQVCGLKAVVKVSSR